MQQKLIFGAGFYVVEGILGSTERFREKRSQREWGGRSQRDLGGWLQRWGGVNPREIFGEVDHQEILEDEPRSGWLFTLRREENATEVKIFIRYDRCLVDFFV